MILNRTTVAIVHGALLITIFWLLFAIFSLFNFNSESEHIIGNHSNLMIAAVITISIGLLIPTLIINYLTYKKITSQKNETGFAYIKNIDNSPQLTIQEEIESLKEKECLNQIIQTIMLLMINLVFITTLI